MQISGPEGNETSQGARISLIELIPLIDKLPFALGSGCLFGLCAPGFELWWLAWFGLVPLLVLIAGCRGKHEALFIGLVFGVGYNLVSLAWYLGLYPLRWMGIDDWLGFQCAVLVWIVESFHEAILFAAFAILVYALPMRQGLIACHRRPFFPYLLSVPLIWVFFQWVVGTSESFLGVPVNQLAYSQYQRLEVIQMAKLAGSPLIDFLLVLSNTALAALVIQLSGWAPKLPDRVDWLSANGGALFDVAVVALLAGLAFCWGKVETQKIAAFTALPPKSQATCFHPPTPLAVIQGNVTIEDEHLSSINPSEISARYALLAHDLGVALLVLPEGVVNLSQTSPGLLLSQLQKIATHEKKEVLTGCLVPIVGGLANAVQLIGPQSQAEALYLKRTRIPLGDFIVTAATPRLFDLGRLLSGNKYPSSVHLLSSVWGRIGASIAMEVVYPSLIAQQVRRGASLLVNVSNLGWFHGSAVSRQILASCVMRAVENERYVVLSTNTGVSAVIDPSGFVTNLSQSERKGVLVGTVQFLYKKTPFTKMWWL